MNTNGPKAHLVFTVPYLSDLLVDLYSTFAKQMLLIVSLFDSFLYVQVAQLLVHIERNADK